MRRMSHCLFAVVVLATGFAASARAADVDPMLPKESEYVMNMNFKQMMDSDIIKKYAMGQIKQALAGEDVKALLETFGVDPLKDLEKATMGFWGSGEDMQYVGVVKGKFDSKKLFEGVKGLAAKEKDKIEVITEKADDKDVTLVKVSQDSGKPMFLTVADDTTILLASEKKFATGALTAFNKKEKAKLSKELTALVLKQDDKASMYMCGVTEGKLKDIPAGSFDGLKQLGIDGDKMKEQVEKMSTFAVTLNVGKEVKMSAVMSMKDADAAEEFNGTLEKIVDTAKTFLPLLGGQQPKAKALIDDLTKSLGTKAKDKDVTLSFALTAKAIGDLAGSDE
ncbi:MAG: hypothetical protein ACOVT5_05900 [Armatimonadaceae bacterium]